MKFCKYCGAKLKPNQVFCEQCGKRVQPQTEQPVKKAAQPKRNAGKQAPHHESAPKHRATTKDQSTVEHADDRQQLEAEIAKLQAKLKDQQQNNRINVFHRLAFSKKHWQQVFKFMNNNAITMLFFFAWAVLLPTLRLWSLTIFLLLTYLYPLLSNEETYPWENKFHDWLNNNDLDNLKRKMASLGKALIAKNQVAPKDMNNYQAHAQRATHISRQEKKMPHSAPVNHHFTIGIEFIFGLILAIVGGIMYFSNRQTATSIASQATSVIKNGALDSSGYLFFWGISLGLLGAVMFIGGIVNGFKHSSHGHILKVLGAIVLLAFAGICSYIYANVANASMSVVASIINGDASVSDYSNMYQFMKLLPWIGTFIYAVGILISGVSNNEE